VKKMTVFVVESVIEKRAAVVDTVAPVPRTVTNTEIDYCFGFFPIPPVAAICRASTQ